MRIHTSTTNLQHARDLHLVVLAFQAFCTDTMVNAVMLGEGPLAQ
jgi:hypothetical protein